MIHPKTFTFLKELKKNNNKPWFETHREEYESAKEDFNILIGQLIKHIGIFDIPIRNLTTRECLFRINRDVRFSKDKSPYKNNMAAYFNKGGKKSNGAGYYFHLEPGKSFAAGGIWMPLPADLAKIRQEIDYNFKDWKKITDNIVFKKNFRDGVDSTTVLQRPPKGYTDDNPAMHFLKMKSFIISKPFTDAEIKSSTYITELAKIFRAMKPMIDFINAAVE